MFLLQFITKYLENVQSNQDGTISVTISNSTTLHYFLDLLLVCFLSSLWSLLWRPIQSHSLEFLSPFFPFYFI